MKSFVALISVITAFLSATLGGKVIPQQTSESFIPVLRFMACSDTHIGGKDDEKLKRIEKAISFCYSVAENDISYKNLDAVMFAGDITDNGLDEQFEAFDKTVKGAIKAETKILAIVAKNHDSNQSKKSIEYCKQITGNDSDYHVVINGFHFIGISTCKKDGKGYTLQQRIWLEKQLADAVRDAKDKPVFVTHHEHVMNTVYGSKYNVDGWGHYIFKDIVEKYSNVIDISGHSHYPLNDARSIWQGSFTAIGTGSMAYMEFTVDGERNIHPDGCADDAQAWLIEVDKDNRVRLRGFDVLHGEFLCDYLIDDVTDIGSFAYTQYNQKALSSAPKFDEGADIRIDRLRDKIRISAPAAVSTDGKPVFLYRITIKDDSGKDVYSQYLLNNYWTVDSYKTITFETEQYSGCTAYITAENSYGMQSEALSKYIK